MRLLVCGGRDFEDVPWLWKLLDDIDRRDTERGGEGIRCLIEGAQEKERFADRAKVGADYWAHQWALARNRPTLRFHADWKGEGRSAGPKRNARMAAEAHPTHCLAMPGGRGTADMVSRMQRAEVRVFEARPTPDHGLG